MAEADSSAALEMRHISKHFGGVFALDDVAIRIASGEVHGLVGQNGSGKSTLIKIISGYHAPDPGAEVWMQGERVRLPLSTRRHGIAVIHQDLGLVDELSVVENLGAGLEFGSRGIGPIRWATERRRAGELFASLGVDIPPRELVGRLGAGQKAMVAIGRAMREIDQAGHRHSLLILDEPTVYLNRTEVSLLGGVVSRLASSGVSVIFVSHRLREIFEFCDRISVLRDGRIVEVFAAGSGDDHTIIRAMIGRDIGSFYPAKPLAQPGRPTALRVDNLVGSSVKGVSFVVREGEILGVTGLAGMGQDELPYLITGARRPVSGSVYLQRLEPEDLSPQNALRHGVVLTPGNRVQHAGWLDASAAENLSLPILTMYFRGVAMRHHAETRAATDLMLRFGVVPPHPSALLRSFSGGNQQKLVLAKWLQAEPHVILLHEPTQGVDAAAKKEILSIVGSLAEGGAAVIFFSSDYEQIANLCHRVIILRNGEILTSFALESTDESVILEACNAA